VGDVVEQPEIISVRGRARPQQSATKNEGNHVLLASWALRVKMATIAGKPAWMIGTSKERSLASAADGGEH
jgi:hypothetical protein